MDLICLKVPIFGIVCKRRSSKCRQDHGTLVDLQNSCRAAPSIPVHRQNKISHNPTMGRHSLVGITKIGKNAQLPGTIVMDRTLAYFHITSMLDYNSKSCIHSKKSTIQFEKTMFHLYGHALAMLHVSFKLGPSLTFTLGNHKVSMVWPKCPKCQVYRLLSKSISFGVKVSFIHFTTVFICICLVRVCDGLGPWLPSLYVLQRSSSILRIGCDCFPSVSF